MSDELKQDYQPLFPEIDDDSNKVTLSYIDKKTKNSLVLTSSSLYKQLQPIRLLAALHRYVAHGNQDAAKEILKKYPELMIEKGSFHDNGLRRVINASAFQYALWALDAHMWTMMLTCLPQNEQGEIIRIQLIKQLESLQSDGLTYNLLDNNGKVECFNTKHYDFNHLIKPLKFYVYAYKKWDISKSIYYWCKYVGSKQVLDGKNEGPPSHLIHEICSNYKAYPLFNTDKILSRTTKFFNYMTGTYENWVSGIEGLGINMGITSPKETYHVLVPSDDDAKRDLECINTLYKVRTERDLPHLSILLQIPLQKSENTPTPSYSCFIS